MKKFRFIHTSDLHLGTPFKGLSRLNEHASSLLTEATYKAFDNVVSIAIKKDVEFVLVCGDLVDSEEGNLRAILHLKKGFDRLLEKGIKVFVVHGNHDPLSFMKEAVSFPESVVVFPSKSPTWHMFRTKEGIDVAIWGMSFEKKSEKRNLARMIPKGPEDAFKIAMLHCCVGSRKDHDPYAPCSLSDLKTDRCQYWALGHIHKKEVLIQDPFAIYCGNIQGRSFKEQGQRGCYLIEVDEDFNVSPTFLETDTVRWMEMEIDVSGISDVSDLFDKSFAQLEKLHDSLKGVKGRGLIARIGLTGTCSFYDKLVSEPLEEEIAEELRAIFQEREPPIFVEAVRNRCRPAIDIESRKGAGDLSAYVLKEAEGISADISGLETEDGPLKSLFMNKRFRKFKISFDPEEKKRMIVEAQYLLLDLLERPGK